MRIPLPNGTHLHVDRTSGGRPHQAGHRQQARAEQTPASGGTSPPRQHITFAGLTSGPGPCELPSAVPATRRRSTDGTVEASSRVKRTRLTGSDVPDLCSRLAAQIPSEHMPLVGQACAAIEKHRAQRPGKPSGVTAFYVFQDADARKGSRYTATYELASETELRKLQVKTSKGRALVDVELAVLSAIAAPHTEAASQASDVALSERERVAYAAHLREQKAALLDNATSPAVIAACIAAMNAQDPPGSTVCMLHKSEWDLVRYLKAFPTHPPYVVSVIGDIDPTPEGHVYNHFTMGLAFRDDQARLYLCFLDSSVVFRDASGLSAAESLRARVGMQFSLGVQNDGTNCAHFAARFARKAARADIQAALVEMMIEAAADTPEGETKVVHEGNPVESSHLLPISFFKEIQSSDLLEQISDAHRQEGDDWNRLPVSGKSTGDGTPSTLQEYYHRNKEGLDQIHSMSIALLAAKDRARALKFIESIESNEDRGAAAWKAALVRMNPRKLPDGQITDGFVGLPLNTTSHSTGETQAPAEAESDDAESPPPSPEHSEAESIELEWFTGRSNPAATSAPHRHRPRRGSSSRPSAPEAAVPRPDR
jgi:hypothetical protein